MNVLLAQLTNSLEGKAIAAMATLVIVTGKALGPISFGDVQIDVISLAGLAAAASFGATAIKSIIDNLNPRTPDVVPPDAT